MTDAAQLQAEAREFQRIFLEVREAIGRVIVGQQRTVEAALVARGIPADGLRARGLRSSLSVPGLEPGDPGVLEIPAD